MSLRGRIADELAIAGAQFRISASKDRAFSRKMVHAVGSFESHLRMQSGLLSVAEAMQRLNQIVGCTFHLFVWAIDDPKRLAVSIEHRSCCSLTSTP